MAEGTGRADMTPGRTMSVAYQMLQGRQNMTVEEGKGVLDAASASRSGLAGRSCMDYCLLLVGEAEEGHAKQVGARVSTRLNVIDKPLVRFRSMRVSRNNTSRSAMDLARVVGERKQKASFVEIQAAVLGERASASENASGSVREEEDRARGRLLVQKDDNLLVCQEVDGCGAYDEPVADGGIVWATGVGTVTEV